MPLDAGFMSNILKIPYFKDLADANGVEWLESIFESLETRSYEFSASPPYETPPVSEFDSTFVFDNLEPLETVLVGSDPDSDDTEIDTDLTQPALAAEAAATPAQAGATGDSDAWTPIRFDNDNAGNNGLSTSDDHSSHYRNSLYYSAKDSEDAVRVALVGAQESLRLSAQDDKIYLFDPQDWPEYMKGGPSTTVYGANGSDTIFLAGNGMSIELGTRNDFGRYGKVELHSVENVVGTDGDDKITGDDNDNKLVGGLGNDTILGGLGDDTITGGAGVNLLEGGEGDDTITGGDDQDTIDGGAGDDTIDGGAGDDNISGGDGDDDITGGAGDDDITGGAGNDTIDGGDGDDTIDGGDGADEIDGGAGNDRVDGGKGNDTLNGDAGNDVINGGAGNDEIDGGAGNDRIDGGEGNDTIDGGTGDDRIDGGSGKDEIDGGAGNDTIDGGAGDDEIDGGDGKDVILGGAGDDTINGGAGADTITGGAGADTLTGGAGKDVFVYTAKADSGTKADTFDIITDFDADDDTFDLSALLDNDTFDFLSAEGTAFTGNGPEVRWDKNGGKTMVEIDLDGDGTADMKIELEDEIDLTTTNFTL